MKTIKFNNEETYEIINDFIDILKQKDIIYTDDGADKNTMGGYYVYTDIFNNNDDGMPICRIEAEYTKDNNFINAQILIKDFN